MNLTLAWLRNMTVNLSWEMVAVSVAILVHAGSTIWWASKVTENIKFIVEKLDMLGRELNKRDEEFKAVWNKIDKLQEHLIKP